MIFFIGTLRMQCISFVLVATIGCFEPLGFSHAMQCIAMQFVPIGNAPPCPFAIVAGDISKSPIQNPLLNGPSDGVVTLDEAFLEGMSEIASVPVLHSFLMSESTVVRATVSFLSGTGLKAALEEQKVVRDSK